MRERVWYSYDPDEGVTLHDTAEEAEQACYADLELYRPDRGGEWAMDVDMLSWGEMICHGEAQSDASGGEREEWSLVRLQPDPERVCLAKKHWETQALTRAAVMEAAMRAPNRDLPSPRTSFDDEP